MIGKLARIPSPCSTRFGRALEGASCRPGTVRYGKSSGPYDIANTPLRVTRGYYFPLALAVIDTRLMYRA